MADETIKCPFCAEKILAEAKKCRFCGEWLQGGEAKKGTGPDGGASMDAGATVSAEDDVRQPSEQENLIWDEVQRAMPEGSAQRRPGLPAEKEKQSVGDAAKDNWRATSPVAKGCLIVILIAIALAIVNSLGTKSTPAEDKAFGEGLQAGELFGGMRASERLPIPASVELEGQANGVCPYSSDSVVHDSWISGFKSGYESGYKEKSKPAF